jgi:hypothetical protein
MPERAAPRDLTAANAPPKRLTDGRLFRRREEKTDNDTRDEGAAT